MPYEQNVLSRARERYEQEKRCHAEEFQKQRDMLYRVCPRLPEIEKELRQSMSRVLAAALRNGVDPVAETHRQQEKNTSLRAERAALLASLGYPENAVTEHPACERCNDTGYDKKTGVMCSCFQKICIEEQNRELSKLLDIGDQSFDTFLLDYYDKTCSGGASRSPYERMTVVKEICRHYAQNFGAEGGIKNLFLTGAPGLGKTFLSAAIAREVSERGFSVVYDTASHVFTQFEAAKFLRGSEEEQNEAREDVHRCLICDLFILDDLGSEMTTPFVRETLYRIVNERLVARKHTVINSNLERSEFDRRYTPAIASRLRGEYRMMVFSGSDIRAQKAKGQIPQQ